MNQMMANFHFIRPVTLLLIPAAFGLWWFWRRTKDPLRGWRQQMQSELLNALTVGRDTRAESSARWLLIGWFLAIVAIAGPTWQPEPNPFADDATPLMILLKADISMMQPDPSPSRMERAHLKIADLAEARPGQPLGLIAYAGSSHLVLPPTRDTDVLTEMASEISPDIMPEAGDRLDLAISNAAQVLSDSNQGGSILVIADLVDTEESLLAEVRKSVSIPIQFLSVNAADSSQRESVRRAASVLGATVEPLDVEGKDIAAIVRVAGRSPQARSGEVEGQWQEAGYWLVPLISVLFLASCRREDAGEKRI